MDLINEAVIAAIFTGAGIFLGKCIDYLKVKRDANLEEKKANLEEKKHDAATEKSELEQAVIVYRELVNGLRDDVKQVVAALHDQEEERLKYLEENFALRAEVKSLRERVLHLEEDLSRRIASSAGA